MSDTDALPPTVNEMDGYDEFLRDIKSRIKASQVRAALAVSRELMGLHWHVGQEIVVRQKQHGWGDGVIRKLADDLKAAFPAIEGLSYRNLYRMRAFYLAYPDEAEFVTQAVSQIPWGHNIALLQKMNCTGASPGVSQSLRPESRRPEGIGAGASSGVFDLNPNKRHGTAALVCSAGCGIWLEPRYPRTSDRDGPIWAAGQND